MAWQFGGNKNKGRHSNHLITEPGYGVPKHAVLGFSTARESYAASSTEQVVQYGGFPTSHGPDQLYAKIIADNPLLRAWAPTYQERAKKGDRKSSPPTKGSLDHSNFHRDNSPPTRDHHYGKYKNYSSDESNDDDDDEKDVVCKDGVCYPKPKTKREEDYERERPQGNGYAHGNHTAPHSISHPKKDPYHETSYNPHGTYNHERPKSSSYNPSSYTVPVSTHPQKDNPPYNGRVSFQPREENPRHTYASPPYTAPISTHPKNDPYHETTYNPHDNYYEKPKGDSYSPPSYTTQPYNRPVVYNPPAVAPIKTRPDHANISTSSPGSPLTPRKDHQETIDSMEARRRYGKASPPIGGAHVDKNKGVIDSQEAAKKYNGVFVNY